jgi:uncharacterized protein DUF6516
VVKRKPKNRLRREKRVDQTLYLSGNRQGALLKEEVWFEGDRVVKYSLASINPIICAADNGRVLGYDNAHDRHHRHFRGAVEDFEFESYEAVVTRFEGELHDLWRAEDGEK